MENSNQNPTPNQEDPVFRERPTEIFVPDAYRFGAVPLVLAGLCALAGWAAAAGILLGLGLFVFAFFRNPTRELPGDERTVISPADGRVIEVAEFEQENGEKALRIAIFLSVFNVHVNRTPIAGRVESVERIQGKYLAAFDPKVDTENARCVLTLRTAQGELVSVTQIVGLIARRIICHPKVGEWIGRGTRYGLIRFGSRTDVLMPATASAKVERGQAVRGGHTVIATLPEVS